MSPSGMSAPASFETCLCLSELHSSDWPEALLSFGHGITLSSWLATSLLARSVQ
jgi:hypothetical protein